MALDYSPKYNKIKIYSVSKYQHLSWAVWVSQSRTNTCEIFSIVIHAEEVMWLESGCALAHELDLTHEHRTRMFWRAYLFSRTCLQFSKIVISQDVAPRN